MGTKKPVACLILTLVFSAAAAAQQSTRPTHQTSDSGSEAQTGSVRGRIVLPSGAQVSAGELDRTVPAAAVKEFDRASKAAKDGKAAEAVEHFRRAISIYPDYLMAHNDLGTQLMSLGKLDEAEEEFRRAIKIGPKVFNPQLNLGIILVQSHKFSEAATTLETALSLDASSPSAHFFAGLAFTVLC